MAIARRFIRWLSSALDAEGLDVTEYVERIECEFEIVVPAEAAEGFATLGDLCGYAAGERQRQGLPLSHDEIWDAVRRITSEEFGVVADELRRDTRYVEDLCC